MFYKKFLQQLGFSAQDESADVLTKKYKDTLIQVDFKSQKIDYGKIKAESETTQNFSQPENWVVLECVDRLLEKGYLAKDIILEKTFKVGHGASGGRLDIFVEKEGKAFLMIECKTWGKEFENELKKINKDGGQLFTYFQNDKNADFLVLYASKFSEELGKVDYKNEIIIIEDSYKQTANVKDFYDRWNKFTKDNGIFEDWVNAYNFKNGTLLLENLKSIKEEDSHFIFNRFLEILRHNTVSDEPNAFNKVFTLFLCKIKDEDKNPDEELDFQWKEGIDDNIKFQKRLSDLYRKAMKEFLEREISDFSDEDFDNKYGALEEELRDKLKAEFTKIRLQKSNEFAIKDVFDEETFNENGKVLKEVVELLQNYKFRYEKKQPFLGDFFELLLATSLKQKSGQFFTPVPMVRFICKSVPIKNNILEKLKKSETDELLPNVIDYAAGSGHFLTETMEEIQNIIEEGIDASEFSPKTKQEIESWKVKPFGWAYKYIYGVEADYRLVKTAKVGCYLHGDGVANIILGDGLDSFSSKKFKNKLKNDLVEKNNERDKNYQDNAVFDFVLSNPPYSISSFKGNLQNKNAKNDFRLYDFLTDQSSEIEALFIERTKQLLKVGGVAGIILPSSILSNSGIYTKAREIILKYFEIVAITELGGKTFMKTPINTVILFLKRRDNYFFENLYSRVKRNFNSEKDVTIAFEKFVTEKPFTQYLNYVWSEEETIDFADYLTLMNKNPNEKIRKHEIFQEYEKKIKAKNENEKWEKILELEQEKMAYFLLAFQQKVVLVKTGEKNEEKRFLGYEFSTRRGSEGIHPIKRGKTIDECTSLFDAEDLYNPEKASTYILEAFEGKEEREIDESLQKNVSRVNLADMMNFDRFNFEKTISLTKRKKINFEKIWNTTNLIFLEEVANIQKGKSITRHDVVKGSIPVVAGGKEFAYFHNQSNREGKTITVSASGANAGFVNYFEIPIFASDCNTIKSKNEKIIKTELLFFFLKNIQNEIYEFLQRGQAQPHVYAEDLAKIKIPNLDIKSQEKIVKEIEDLEEKAKKIVINDLKEQKNLILKKYL